MKPEHILAAAALMSCISLGTAQAGNRHVHVQTTVCFEATCEAARLRIWDGDTFIIDGPGRKPLKIRIENIDTPEIEGRCAYETDLAQRSKQRLAALLRTTIAVHTGRLDRYGRQLATITAGGRDVGEILVSERLARRWDGARHSWCSGADTTTTSSNNQAEE